MSSKLSFRVIGEPTGRVHVRPQLRWRKGAKGKQPFAAAVPEESSQQRSWVAMVRDSAQEAMAASDFPKHDNGGFRLSVEYVRRRPKAYHWKRPHAEPYCANGIDLNNYFKALEDALTGVLWHDDAQVTEYGRSRKRFARPGEPSHAVVTLEYLGEWMGASP